MDVILVIHHFQKPSAHLPNSGSNPVQRFSTGAAMQKEHALHPAVGQQSWRPTSSKGMFVPFLGAAPSLLSWTGLTLSL